MITTQINLDQVQPGIIRKYLFNLFIIKNHNRLVVIGVRSVS